MAEAGDRGATLRALRDLLAREIQACESSRDLAALTRQFTDVLKQIDALPGAAEGTPLDELAKRRGARGAGSPGSSRSSRGA